MAQISLKVNGRVRMVDTDAATPLLYVLRNDLELKGPRFGCGLGQCGACAVILDGKAIRSCITPVNAAQNRAITTLEGLGSSANPHALQRAFVEEQAAQCGFCMNGILMNAKALLDKNPSPTADEIRTALDPILCRCGSHLRVIRAFQRATVYA
jgi:nicotinate dehydrogenase subunit A